MTLPIPSIPNVIGQVAITGSSAPAPEQEVVRALEELGFDQARAREAVKQALELGVIRRNSQDTLEIAGDA